MSNYPDDDYERRSDRYDDCYDDAEPDPQTIAAAKSRVIGPAIGLIITGVLGLALAALNAVQAAQFEELWQKEMQEIEDNPTIPADKKQEQLELMDKIGRIIQPLIIPQAIFVLLISLVILVAGVNLQKLTSSGLVKTGAILSLIPCISPCCFLGLVFGIWTLIVMAQPEVKAGFAAVRRSSYR
jgi:hypothetical protein